MTQEMTGQPRHRCRSSYRTLGEVADALRSLDEKLTAVERAIARPAGADDARWRLRIADGRTVLVEGGAPYTTLYVTPPDATPPSEEAPLRPAIDLPAFWRLWRPPLALVGPRDRRWLTRRGLAGDPAPPLPARYERHDGWRDFPAASVPDLTDVVARTADALSEGGSDRQKGAA